MNLSTDFNWRKRKRFDIVFRFVCAAATVCAVAALFLVLANVVIDGAPHLTLQFLASGLSHRPGEAGILPALIGSVYVVGLAVLIAAPVGVGAAIYMEELSGRRTRLRRYLRILTANLAGVPSIVYGLVGLALFVRWFSLGQSVLAGALTLCIVILPMIVVVTEEALRSTPPTYREASAGLGADSWQTVRLQVLPVAWRGIVTGLILSIARATGETAPLIMVGSAYYVTGSPGGLLDRYTVLPMQIYNWASDARPEFHAAAAAATLVLLTFLLSLNAVVLMLRNRARSST